jgi:hypothetical protein
VDLKKCNKVSQTSKSGSYESVSLQLFLAGTGALLYFLPSASKLQIEVELFFLAVVNGALLYFFPSASKSQM